MVALCKPTSRLNEQERWKGAYMAWLRQSVSVYVKNSTDHSEEKTQLLSSRTSAYEYECRIIIQGAGYACAAPIVNTKFKLKLLHIKKLIRFG